MNKVDPLIPVSYYFRNMVIPGMGLGLEGYVLFSIGNVRPLLQAAFSKCWNKFTICNETWTESLDYLEVSGIIVGQVGRSLLVRSVPADARGRSSSESSVTG